MERYGAADVPKQRKREKNRICQADFRRRKKEGVTMTKQERNRLLREGGNPQLTKQRLEKQERRNAKKQGGAGGAEGLEPIPSCFPADVSGESYARTRASSWWRIDTADLSYPGCGRNG